MSGAMGVRACLLALGVLIASGCEDDEGETMAVDAGVDAAIPSEAGLDAGGTSDAGKVGDAGSAMQSVTIRFKAKVGAEDFVCGRAYANQGSTRVSATPQDFRFYVQEVRLINRAGQEVPVVFDAELPNQTKDVALIDFTDGQGACGGTGGPTTNMVIQGKVPAGDYNGVVFVNGVPEQLNHADPAQAPAPLRITDLHWNWVGGYRFIVAELLPVMHMTALDGGMHGAAHDGGSASDAGSTADAGTSGHGGGAAASHVGSTGCSGVAGSISCTKANRNRVRLEGFNPASSFIVADLGAVFSSIDLTSGAVCHGLGASCAASYGALGIDYATGAAAAQQVFRVE